jgi:hypothetical protein
VYRNLWSNIPSTETHLLLIFSNEMPPKSRYLPIKSLLKGTVQPFEWCMGFKAHTTLFIEKTN